MENECKQCCNLFAKYGKHIVQIVQIISHSIKRVQTLKTLGKHMVQIVSYSTDNTKRGRTCGSGKKYKQCCGK